VVSRSSCRLSIIVPAYNEERYLQRCLVSLRRQSQSDFELIVVDNNSCDDTVSIAERYADTVLRETEQGYHHAARRGIAESQGILVAVCDADTRYPSDWVATIYAQFRPEDVGIYGSVNFHDGHWLYRAAVRFFCFTVFMRQMRMLGIDVCNGFNFVFRKSVYDEVGGYDANLYDKVGLDIHLGRRLKRRGPLRFVPRLQAYTSMRRISDHGLWHFVSVNIAMYWSFLRGRETRTSYTHYNAPPARGKRKRR
jgi:glycosyltransferase involved in cell wall biosynthesis